MRSHVLPRLVFLLLACSTGCPPTSSYDPSEADSGFENLDNGTPQDASPLTKDAGNSSDGGDEDAGIVDVVDSGTDPTVGGPIYDENVVATYHLQLAPSDWLKIVDDPKGEGDAWQMAAMTWEGETLERIGVKAVGHWSRIPGNPKPGIRLKFDKFVEGRRWYDVDSVKLDSMIGNTDASMMVDRLSYWVYRQMGVAASRSAHARLYVNGTYIGLYQVEEPIRKAFIRARFGGGDDGNLYECDYANGQTWPGIDRYLWRGSDPSDYVPFPFYAKTNEEDGNFSDLVELCNIFNNIPLAERREVLSTHIQLEDYLTYLAVLVAIADWDGITSGGAQTPNNHFWYHRQDRNRMQLIPWDPGVALGQTGHADPPRLGSGPPWIADERITTDIWFRFDSTVATAWVPHDAWARNIYLSKLRQVVDGPLSQIGDRIDFIYDQIREHAYADPNKPFSNAEFDDTVIRRRDDWIPRRRQYIRDNLLEVTGFTLMDIDTGTDIGPVANGDAIDLGEVGSRLNIRAEVNGSVGSVRFGLDGDPNYRLDTHPPQYTLITTAEGNEWHPSAGSHTVMATPYSEVQAGGVSGASLSITFTVE